MRNIRLAESTFGSEEREAVLRVFDSGRLTMGPTCEAFEKAFAATVGARHAVFCNSGGSANMLAALAVSAKYTDLRDAEVLVPATTWPTTVWPFVFAGATPVFVDCDPDTLQMDLGAAKRAITRKTRAICLAHIMGNACDVEAAKALARASDLVLIEDSCGAFGTKVDGRYVGTLGPVGTFSFFFSHHLSTIEGGMLATQDHLVADIARSVRSHGWARPVAGLGDVASLYPDIEPRFLFLYPGFNFKPTEIQAAIGLVQLKKARLFDKVRAAAFARWTEAFSGRTDFRTIAPGPNVEPSWFGYAVVCRDTRTRDALRVHLESHGIETRMVSGGNLARQPAFKGIGRAAGDLSGSDKIMTSGLFWGLHGMLTDEDIDYVVDVVARFAP